MKTFDNQCKADDGTRRRDIGHLMLIRLLAVLILGSSLSSLHAQEGRGDERGPLRIEGASFRDQSGAFWMWRGCTDFMLFARYVDGEDIDGLLSERIQVGCRVLRVLGMAHNIPANAGRRDFAPATYGDRYWAGLAAFADKLAARGLRFEFVVFADAQLLMPRLEDQRAHLARVAAALRPKWNALGELVNEWPQNGVNPGQFEKPAGLWSRGSALGGQPPFAPPWDWIDHHGRRSADWYRDETAREIRGGINVPVVQDEPIGAAEAAVPGRRDNVPDHFRWAAALWAFTGGATFHSDAGIDSKPFGPNQKACAVAFFEALRTVPPEAQTWRPLAGADLPLTHVNRPDPGGSAATVCRANATVASCVAVDPGPNWRARPQNGWRITAQSGRRGEIVRLTR
jgi:hypothetical protein